MRNQHRSVMLLIADDWSRIAGCYGNDIIRTPRIDEFAARGVVFDNGFCTSPSCAVSRACLLTGQHSHTHGQYGHCHGIQGFHTHEWMSSLPQDFRNAGFATACIGKRHVEPQSVYPFEYERGASPKSNVHQLAEYAREFLNNNTDRPFYMHVGFSEPHRITRKWGDLFSDDVLRANVPAQTYSEDEVIVPPFLPDLPEVRREMTEYYEAVSRFDYGVGLLLDELEKSGRAEETLVVVTTDHAMPFPGAKASSFDSGHHCPFILRAPDGPQGTRNQAMINWLDFRPTVHDWCGLPPSQELPGRSLLPILSTPEPEDWDEVVFSHCFHEVMDYNPYRVLRGRRYKYVRNLAAPLKAPFPTDLFRSPTWRTVREQNLAKMGVRNTQNVVQGEAEELYNIETDPYETVNRIDDPALQSVADEMRQRLTDFRVATKDPWLEVDFQEGRIDFDPEASH